MARLRPRIVLIIFLLVPILASVAMALGQYDGSYGGMTTIVRNEARIGSGEPLCTVTPTRNVWRVVDSNIQLVWQGVDWRVMIRPDGMIGSSGTVGMAVVSASGKVTGNALVLFYGTESCGYRFEGFRGG